MMEEMFRWIATVLFVIAATAQAQQNTGELRLTVFDPTGAPMPARGSIIGQATVVHREFVTGPQGRHTIKALPFGAYRLELRHEGFVPYSEIVEIRSALPVEKSITLSIAGVGTEVVVTDAATLVDPRRTGGVQYIGGEALRDSPASLPGRSVLDLVNSQPGWLLEANGVLHPRGAEYDTQYIVDGIPITDNRSPAFAPDLDSGDVQSLTVLTGNYPAEYGRKMGGVVEVTTQRDSRPGFHGKVSLSGGSFDTAAGSLSAQYAAGHNMLAASMDTARTDRYLDPPTLDNFTNTATSASGSLRYERDFTHHDRLRISGARRETRFLVPDELLQAQAGQRQDRATGETMGQAAYQHIFSPQVLANVRGMARDLSAALWSNALSTPIFAGQNRGFREAYINGSISAHVSKHELKAGGEASFANLNEEFNYRIVTYRIAGMRIFDRDTPPAFAFAGTGKDREQSAFAQDLFHAGRLTISAGIRWDHYSLLVDESAASPRLGIAWHVPSAGLVLRASYDRVFQTPAMENILLSSSPAARALNNTSVFLPVRPSRGNLTEIGLTKALAGKLRLDGQYFRRDLDHFADDSLLLNTGVTFPIAFSHASIHGFEAKLELPRWGTFSGFLSYSNLSGKAQLPVTGGLFLGDESADVLNSSGRLPITQDQRNTVSARLRTDAGSRTWFAVGAAYGSGLPIEADSVDLEILGAQYGQAVVDRVNFDRGRVRPSFSLDASAGFRLLSSEHANARLQADVFNITNHLNVINFAGLFSGTAIGKPRSASLRLQVEF
jgi:outer membrane cobalamin receptor